MSTVVAVEYLSLDGVMEEPGWSMPYFNDELGDFQNDNLFGSDALLLGRVTYEGFKAAWPTMTDEDGFADKINSMPKFVVTSSTAEPEWNATFISGDIAETVRELKSRPNNNLLINGSGQLFRHLNDEGLIDEYRFMVYPVVVGNGKRLFPENGQQKGLDLVRTQITSTGVAVLTYTPAK